MIKLILFSCVIFLTPYCQQVSADPISSLPSSVNFEDSLETLLTLAPKDSDGMFLLKIDNQNIILKKYFEKLTSYSIVHPELRYFIDKKKQLEVHFHRINRCYDEAIQVVNKFNNGTYFLTEEYDDIRYNLLDCRNDFDSIYDILLEDEPTTSFMAIFIAAFQKFQVVCDMDTSNQQVLGNMLKKVKIATLQYYVLDSIRSELLFYMNEHKGYLFLYKVQIERVKENLIDYIKEKYDKLSIKFKDMMGLTSRDYWKCDTPEYKDVVRHKYNKDVYHEILAFQKFLDWERYLPNCRYTDNYDRKDFGICDDGDTWCNTSPCPGELFNCRYAQPLYYCLKNKMSVARFSHAVYPDDKSSLNCTGMIGEVTDDHKVCECMCTEKKYYIHIRPQYAYPNKTVTGARFILRLRRLYLQIELGDLLPNGVITNTEWVPLPQDYYDEEQKFNKEDFVEVKWETNGDGVRGFDLTKVEVPGKVITGLSLAKNKRGRIGLRIFAANVNFRTGEISESEEYKSPPGRNQITIHDCDASSKGPKENDIMSNLNNYIYLWLTSVIKDAGQSVIPFIDGQKAAPKERVPFSGVALIHRRQEGYGGFLGIKFYTFDLSEFIMTNEVIRKPPNFLKPVLYLNKTTILR